ncbi:MAG: YgiT-type zinc finger protein [Acidobacteriota bacterium]
MDQDFCEYCNSILPNEEKQVTVCRHRRGQHFIFEQVSANVCPRCGERYYSAAVMREMDRLMKQPDPLAGSVTVPVMALRTAA